MHRRQPLPRLWMMTDERQGDRLFHALDRFPEGAGVVFRHYGLAESERRRLFDEVQAATRHAGLMLLLGGDPQLAAAWGADGSHGLYAASPAGPGLLRSAPVHDLEELRAAQDAGVDLVFVSPVFATRSHPNAPLLGPDGFGRIARAARVPVIALGGMDSANARSLEDMNMYGWAAIDAWTSPETDRG